MRTYLLSAVLGLAAAVSAGAYEVNTIGEFRFLGGQDYFNGNPSSLSGNLSFSVIPAIKFNERFTLAPTYMGSYRGTKEVNDLAGGGTLFQDSQTHYVSLKGLYSVTPALKIKPAVSYRVELLRETKNETWGKGLFDYSKVNTGIEAEYRYREKGVARAAIDRFVVRFPNYETLESSVAAAGMGREQAGKKTLDSNSLSFTLSGEDFFGKTRATAGFSYTSRAYPDQPLVGADGSFTSSKRGDTVTSISAGATRPFLFRNVRFVGALDAQYALNDSNQGNYDVSDPMAPRYTADYYDYTLAGVFPSLTVLLGQRPAALTLSAGMTRQNYGSRKAMDVSGVPLAENVHISETIFGVTFIYPVTKELRLRVTVNTVDASSNMKYAGSYAYNYSSSNYLMGFSYEF